MNKKFIEDNINLMHYIASKVGASLSDEDRQDLVHDVCIKLLESKEEADRIMSLEPTLAGKLFEISESHPMQIAVSVK